MRENGEDRIETVFDEWCDLCKNEGVSRNDTELMYRQQVFPLVLERFIERYKLREENRPALMIVSVGTSPEPIILSLSAQRPRRVVFLVTHESLPYLDQIVKSAELRPRDYQHRTVPSDDPVPVYEALLDVLKDEEVSGRIVAEISSGTKPLVSGLSMAAAVLGLQATYVSTREYLKDYHRPKPGTEELVSIDNPWAVFAPEQRVTAENMLARFDFHGAASLFRDLAAKVPDPREYQRMALLTEGYGAWDSLDIGLAVEKLEEARNLARQHHRSSTESLVRVEKQIARVQRLHRLMPKDLHKSYQSTLSFLRDKQAASTLLMTLLLSAEIRALQGRYDTAVLLLYRILEMLPQIRLAAYGIDTSRPDYEVLYVDREVLEERFRERSDLIHKRSTEEHLPDQISLVQGYILLECFEDEFTLESGSVHWARFKNEIAKRNRSIFAHGFVFVRREDYEHFRSLVDDLLGSFYRVWGLSLEEERAVHEPVNRI